MTSANLPSGCAGFCTWPAVSPAASITMPEAVSGLPFSEGLPTSSVLVQTSVLVPTSKTTIRGGGRSDILPPREPEPAVPNVFRTATLGTCYRTCSNGDDLPIR